MQGMIDFNSDIGESFGAYQLGHDGKVIKHITSANIACGFHAGDPTWMRYSVNLAEEHGVVIGAHPGFPDMRGFGRQEIWASPEQVKNDVIYQIGALTAFTKAKKLQHVKPHGALYNMAVAGGDMAKAICEAICEVDQDLILVVLAGTPMVEIAERMGLRVAREAFADRELNADGTLVPRSMSGSMIHDLDRLVDRSIKMVIEGKATAITGEEVSINAHTICLHSDTPGADSMAAALRTAMEAAGVEIVPMHTIV